MSQLSSRSAHLPECTEIPVRQMYEEALRDVEPDSLAAAHIRGLIKDDTGDVSILRCADGCPILAAALERGRELADHYDWGNR